MLQNIVLLFQGYISHKGHEPVNASDSDSELGVGGDDENQVDVASPTDVRLTNEVSANVGGKYEAVGTSQLRPDTVQD